MDTTEDSEAPATPQVPDEHVPGDPDYGIWDMSYCADPDSRQFVTAGEDGLIRKFDWDKQEQIHFWKGHTNAVTAVRVLDTAFMTSASTDMTVKVWQLKDGWTPDPYHCVATLTGHTSAVLCLDTLAGRRLMSGSADNSLRLWCIERAVAASHGIHDFDIGEKALLSTLRGHRRRVNCVKTLDATQVVSGSHDNTVKAWDLFTSKCIGTLKAHNGFVWCLSRMIGQEKLLLSGGGDNLIKIWDLTSGKCEAVLDAHMTARAVNSLEPLDSRSFVSASSDKQLRIWDIRKMKTTRILTGHTDYIRCVLAVGSSNTLVSADDKGHLRQFEGSITREPDDDDDDQGWCRV